MENQSYKKELKNRDEINLPTEMKNEEIIYYQILLKVIRKNYLLKIQLDHYFEEY